MVHHFNTKIAEIVGVNAAVIFENIHFWIEKNRANEKHYYDGCYWTYNSKKAFIQQFPYFTERQIEYALRKLIDGGYVITGNYNKSAYDRTLWYSITKQGYCILQNCGMETQNLQNGSTKNVDPIPDNKTNKEPKDNPFPTEKGGASKKNYNLIFDAPENVYIKEALVKWVNVCRGRGVKFQCRTLERWAKILRDNAGENPEIALAVVDQSIAAGWKDLYRLKNAGVEKPKISMERFDPEKDQLATDENGNPLIF